MNEPNWLSIDLVLAIHEEQLREFGGPPGLRDAGMLESALARPVNKYVYGVDPVNKYVYGVDDVAALAAAYGYGLARNHAFVDGNKRTALLAIITFLGLNEIDFVVPEAEAVVMILEVAAGEVSEESLARWIRDNWPEQGEELRR